MPDTAYTAPVFHDGIWYPTPNTMVRGKLVSVTGVAYEFAPDRAIPHLNLSVPAAAPDDDGTYRYVNAARVVEVHCFPERLLKEVMAVRPREGEEVEITTGVELVGGFLTYVVSAGGRWSTAEHWAPEEISRTCAFGAQHLFDAQPAAERTQVVAPVSARDSKSPEDALDNATDLIKPDWPGLISGVGGSDLFGPPSQFAQAQQQGINPFKDPGE